jgi:hypothetical protein
MIVWGSRDPIIPAAHGEHAHKITPGSRLEIFAGVGHFPQLERPADLARVLLDFTSTTEPSRLDLTGEDLTTLRRMLTNGPSPT